MNTKTKISARITERHGYAVTIALSVEPVPGAPTDMPTVPFLMHEAAHRVAAEIWASAARRETLPRWAVDVTYARVTIELVEGESVHDAVAAAEAACMYARIQVAGDDGRTFRPAKAAPRAAKKTTAKRRATR